MSDLRTRLLVEIERRELYPRIVNGERWAAAEDDECHCVRIVSDDVEEDGWIVASGMTGEASDYAALHDPGDALRRYSHYRRVLDRAVLIRTSFLLPGMADSMEHELAEALGIPIEEPTDAR